MGTWVRSQKSLPEDALHTNIAVDNTSPEISGNYTARCKGKPDLTAGASCSDTAANSTEGPLRPRYLGPCHWGHHRPLPTAAKSFCQQLAATEKRLLSPSVGIRDGHYTCKTLHLGGTQSTEHFPTHYLIWFLWRTESQPEKGLFSCVLDKGVCVKPREVEGLKFRSVDSNSDSFSVVRLKYYCLIIKFYSWPSQRTTI